ncbi:MAG: hypothetical protein NT126_05020 [Bacteroidetes bacterium]|nr:hypothetical protein [Bacteroidota bacterium]
MRIIFKIILFIIPEFFLSLKSSAFVPTPDHVVILVLENHGYGQVVGSAAAPYINGLISDPASALFTQSYALSHPSQPNYIQLFSGSNQGVVNDNVPTGLPFAAANLGAELLSASKTFSGYSEDLPSVGFTGATSLSYARKHNPWVNWQGTGTNGIPTTANQPFTAFPVDYNLLPTVSFVIPNLVNDMHDGTDPTRISTCDTWISTNMNSYIQWAKTHNSLLILTFDEDDNASSQKILTLFIGSMVQDGSYPVTISHYNILRMLEDMYGLGHAGAASTSATIDYCWNACYQSPPTVSPAGPITICTGNSVTLTASSGSSYLWSNGATTQSIVVTDSGSYYVRVQAANGCTAITSPVVVSVTGNQPNATLFTESIGTVAATTAIATHEANNGFDNDNFLMYGSGDIRNTNSSSGYTGASGLGNAFLTNTAGKNFVISGINTSGLSNLQLSFGVYKSSTTGIGSNGSDLSISLSTDSLTYPTTLTIDSLPTGAGTAVWYYRTAKGTIPSAPNLRIQFKQNGTTTQYRIDDIKLLYTAVPTITAGGPTTFCQGDSVLLTASSGTSYLWSNGANTQSTWIKTSGSYSVIVNCVSSAPVTVTVNSCTFPLHLKVFFEGFYFRSDSMQATVNPVAYPKTFDTITVELHDTTALYSLKSSARDTISTRGTGTFDFPLSIAGHHYYIVIRHRNSLETWSKSAVLFPSTGLSYDFTSPDTTVANNTSPILNSILPASTASGSSSFAMTLTGSNFNSGSIVKWNGSSLATSYVSATQLTATVPSANVISAGTTSVTVFNPAPGGGTSSSVTFTVNNPSPVLSSITPSSSTAGASSTSITLTGSNFVNGSVANWNGSSLSTTYVSATQLTATVPSTNLISAGTASVTVFNPTPGGGTSSSVTFTVNNPSPVLSSITPSSATAGTSSISITLTGSNFVTGSVVNWNGSALSTTYVSATQLTAIVPSANLVAAGTASVTVFNPTPGGGTSASVTFTMNAAVPSAKKFLFDATKAETAGNADWVIDEDGSTPQRIPTPAQSGIISSTAETFWTGAISSWGIALVKNGQSVETLPSGTAITYGNVSNSQDLSNYDVFVVDEPNIVFTAAEKTAILNFVSNGGGLFMVADHTVSDRNNDGWDSPAIWNDLMTNNTIQNNPFGFSIDLTNISEISSNVLTNSGSNPILNGTQGTVTQMEFNNGATITTNTTANPNVQGLIWQNTFSQGSTHLMCASSTFGSGRVFIVTDSSPMDDGTGASGNTLFVGWPLYSHTALFMNASLWLAKLQ